jgi:hypothetical protein
MKKKAPQKGKQKKNKINETQKAAIADDKRTYLPHHLALPASQ